MSHDAIDYCGRRSYNPSPFDPSAAAGTSNDAFRISVAHTAAYRNFTFVRRFQTKSHESMEKQRDKNLT
jgi:hypothetical protein